MSSCLSGWLGSSDFSEDPSGGHLPCERTEASSLYDGALKHGDLGMETGQGTPAA